MSTPVLTRDAIDECCGSRQWRRLMFGAMPFGSEQEALTAAENAFDSLSRADWLEAFGAHSTIGAIRPGDWTGAREQAGLEAEDGDLRTALAAANVAYRDRFGFVFLIRARGRTAREMLDALHARLGNPAEIEFATACEQQREIAALRLHGFVGAEAA